MGIIGFLPRAALTCGGPCLGQGEPAKALGRKSAVSLGHAMSEAEIDIFTEGRLFREDCCFLGRAIVKCVFISIY